MGERERERERERGPSYAKGIGLRNIKIILGNHSASQKKEKVLTNNKRKTLEIKNQYSII